MKNRLLVIVIAAGMLSSCAAGGPELRAPHGRRARELSGSGAFTASPR